MRPWHRVRLAVNLLNGSTLAGLVACAAGHARLARFPGGLLVGTGYRLPVPPAPAFTLGNVILTRHDVLGRDTVLLRHEARHSTQYAWCGGLLMLPLYFAAAGVSWLLSGDVGAWNIFERAAGLADGGYADRPLRRSLPRRRRPAETRGRGAQAARLEPGPGQHAVQLASVPVRDEADVPD
jgi:hypothetical protein